MGAAATPALRGAAFPLIGLSISSTRRLSIESGGKMSAQVLFNIQLVLGYVAWGLCFSAYIMPRLRLMDAVAAQRAIATLHSFRFFGLVFILPGVVGPE